jgi:hypothetical protein
MISDTVLEPIYTDTHTHRYTHTHTHIHTYIHAHQLAHTMESDKANGEVFLFTSESVGEGHPGK